MLHLFHDDPVLEQSWLTGDHFKSRSTVCYFDFWKHKVHVLFTESRFCIIMILRLSDLQVANIKPESQSIMVARRSPVKSYYLVS